MAKSKPILFSLIAFALLTFIACSRAEPSRSEFVLDTLCIIRLYDQATDRIYRDIFSRLHEIEDRMSAHRDGTYVVRINEAAGIEPVQVPGDVFKVIERALHFAELSGGAFDPTIRPLLSLWDIRGSNPRVPSQEEIDAVLPLVNWRNVELDRERSTVFLTQPGMALDLGSIAKGFAADEAAEIIRRARIRQAIVNLGGDVVTVGRKRDRNPWWIGLQNPAISVVGQRTHIGIISVPEISVVASSVTERYFIKDGVRYHHLFSPFTGFPARTGLLSVVVIAAASMDADALSTIAFVLGYEKGRAIIDTFEGVEAIFVFEAFSIRITEGVDFSLTDERFRLLD